MPPLMDLSARQLLDAISAPTPTPGGGSSAALAGAIGASLVLMVASLPKTKNGTAEERAALDGVAALLRPARDRLAELVDADATAYDAVMAAYRKPKTSDVEVRQRQDAIQAGLVQATDVPLEVARLCEHCARHAAIVARHGTPAASSDLGVGLALLEAAAAGGALNVRMNLGQISDGEYAARVAAELRRLDTDLDRAIAQARQGPG